MENRHTNRLGETQLKTWGRLAEVWKMRDLHLHPWSSSDASRKTYFSPHPQQAGVPNPQSHYPDSSPLFLSWVCLAASLTQGHLQMKFHGISINETERTKRQYVNYPVCFICKTNKDSIQKLRKDVRTAITSFFFSFRINAGLNCFVIISTRWTLGC